MPGVPLILLGNKVDLEDKREVTSPFVSIPLDSNKSAKVSPKDVFTLWRNLEFLYFSKRQFFILEDKQCKKMWSKMTLVRHSFILPCTPAFENNNFTTRVPTTLVQVPRERGELLARQHSMAFMETSARTGVNVAQVSVTLNLN